MVGSVIHHIIIEKKAFPEKGGLFLCVLHRTFVGKIEKDYASDFRTIAAHAGFAYQEAGTIF
jgi:hypothetical protein